MTEIDARNLPLWALAAVLLLAALAVFFLYRRERGLVPRRSGHLLTGLRILEVGILVLLAADPLLRVTREVEVRGGLLVIVDVSRSMSIVDRDRSTEERARDAEALGLPPGEIAESQRIDLVRRALEGEWLRALSRRFDISLLTLAKDLQLLQPSPLDPAEPVLPELPPADGSGTDLGRPIAEEAARRPRGSLSGIVLLTDGNHHGARDPREAARALAALEAPIVAVGVGALERPPDLSLEAVEGPRKVFSGDQVAVSAVIAASGLTRRKVSLTVEADQKTLGTVEADVSEGDGVTRAPISFPAGEPGRKKVTVRFPPVEGEVSASNNSCDFWLEVLSEKARVLFLDGAPRWEERYLRAAWSRDENVELHRFLVTAPPERRLPGGFPRSRDEIFAHDVIVLGDVEPGIFTTEEIESLRDFAAVRGGALVLIAGERSMPYRWAGSPLAAALPVRLIEPPPPAGLGTRMGREGLPLALTAAGETSEITRLVPGREQNLRLWQLLPEARWLSPMAGLEPGAEALVTVKPDRAARLPEMPALPRKGTEAALAEEAARLAAERAAVVVTRVFGAGRVLLVTIDSTWKWRYRVGDEIHRKFWGQVVRWAVSTRLGAEDSHVKLGTDSLI
ncbi:MAG TPA: vWA domain-containing protein, partial [Planctomycetota bacterium]|nr:vWA domain-containing protein [Planctomycetota bacterium]